jgi:hypothetical protein
MWCEGGGAARHRVRGPAGTREGASLTILSLGHSVSPPFARESQWIWSENRRRPFSTHSRHQFGQSGLYHRPMVTVCVAVKPFGRAMDASYSGFFVHFAAALLILLLTFAAWIALRFPRLPAAVPQATAESGRPATTPAQPQPLRFAEITNRSQASKVHAQPKASTPPLPKPVSEGEDHITPISREEPAPVEFSIYAPTSAPPDIPFDIRINISVYDDSFAATIAAAGYKTFETLVLSLRKGDPLRLELQPDGIELDAPEQTIVWNGRDMTAVFVGRLPSHARPSQSFTSSLKVYLYEIPLGLIYFSITCDEQIKLEIRGAKQIWHKQQMQEFAKRLRNEGKGFGALRYRRVFICHVSSDTEAVSYIKDFLLYSGIEAVYAPTDFYVGPRSWRDMAQDHIMHTCNAMLLCWSDAARRDYEEREDSPIKFEMDLALKRETKEEGRQFAIIPYQLGGAMIPLPKAFGERPMNSPGLAARLARARKLANL